MRIHCLVALVLLGMSEYARCQTGQAIDDAGPPPASSHPVVPGVPPIRIERQQCDGPCGVDRRRRYELGFGSLRQDCPGWHFEVSAQPDGRIIFQVNEPVGRQVVLGAQIENKRFEAMLGDNSCYFRIKIERNR